MHPKSYKIHFGLIPALLEGSKRGVSPCPELHDTSTYCSIVDMEIYFVTQELIRELGDGSFTGTLAADSSNVVTLVRDLYNVSVVIIR